MTENLESLLNQVVGDTHPSKTIGSSISEIGTDAVNHSYEGDDSKSCDSSLENEEILKMEVKQLKRENAFLKSKIEELKAGTSKSIKVKSNNKKKVSLNCLNVLRHRAINNENKMEETSIHTVLAEIKNQLISVATLYKIEIDESRLLENSKTDSQIIALTPIIERQAQEKEFKQNIQRKLESLSYNAEQDRYTILLSIFAEFYKKTSEEEAFLKEQIEKQLEIALNVSKQIIDKATERANLKSLKASNIFNSKMFTERDNDHEESSSSVYLIRDQLGNTYHETKSINGNYEFTTPCEDDCI